ncbi:MAG: MipA/OmpV family protein [Novosphingobium sp.]|uniref:MipA/OmpV family protein n=1 Tax=Novosphingobium sp. TaxID=1874826 RepID=UPI003C7AF37E
MNKSVATVIAISLAASAAPATAQEAEPAGRIVVIGAGIELVPKYPGASSGRAAFLPVFDTWRSDEPEPAEAPDETISFALSGKRGSGISVGPSFTFVAGRSAKDLPGLPEFGTTVELGGFVEAWPLQSLRLRGELRQGFGGHKALTGDLSADLVWRGPRQGTMVTVGPRVRWGSEKFTRVNFGVPLGNSAGFSPFAPSSGIYSYGVAAGFRMPLDAHFGLYTYLRYDRLTDRVAASPIVVGGSADQFSGGLALTYRFGI